ncbi:MAG: 50S ribosomal protein L11 methyltransferase [Bdellovibrionales bacterium]|nr:50S ribosomal protein L11 methyltransferase [Bdellovibrionales bacterium]
MSKEQILRFELAGKFREELSLELVGLGALGAVESPEGNMVLYCAPEWLTEDIFALVASYDCSIISTEIEDGGIDYVSESELNWFPIYLRHMTIYPVLDDSSSPPRENAIFVKPGAGFGTGHHPTTRMMLFGIESLNRGGDARPKTLWDIGAGSGLLGILFSRCFGGEVVAWEPDELAIRNFRDNIQLNGCKINLIGDCFGDKGIATASPDVIASNLYSSLHEQYEQLYRKYLRPGGLLLLSGVLESERGVIEKVFSSTYWRRNKVSRCEAWLMFEYERISGGGSDQYESALF